MLNQYRDEWKVKSDLGIRDYTKEEEKLIKRWLKSNKITLCITESEMVKTDKKVLKEYNVRVR